MSELQINITNSAAAFGVIDFLSTEREFRRVNFFAQIRRLHTVANCQNKFTTYFPRDSFDQSSSEFLLNVKY